ncbi:MAG: TIGR02757 family protein [Planctomycetes bacterium]|nr:TIGR02757 family protein [Planctomycetota bacterium]
MAPQGKKIPPKEIKRVLDRLYVKYNRKDNIAPDPLGFVYKYSSKADREIAGLLSAVLAYGRVAQISNSLEKLMSTIGPRPAQFVKQFDKSKQTRLKGFKHRFNTGRDIADLLELLKWVLEKHGSIERFFIKGLNKDDTNIVGALSVFCRTLLQKHAAGNNGIVRQSFKYLLSDPANKSACKRLNLYLRWMVRDDDVDAGTWKRVDKSKLIVPMDVHMSRVTRIMGFHDVRNITLKTAVEVTARFAEIEPADPVKYDFVLCRMSMIGEGDGWEKIKRYSGEK